MVPPSKQCMAPPQISVWHRVCLPYSSAAIVFTTLFELQDIQLILSNASKQLFVFVIIGWFNLIN